MQKLLSGHNAAFSAVLERCLYLDPAKRIESADQLYKELLAVSAAFDKEPKQKVSPARRLKPKCVKVEEPAPVQAITEPLCIWGSPAFGCELSAVLAKKQSTLLFDTDLTAQDTKMLLGVKQLSTPSDSEKIAGIDLTLPVTGIDHLTAQVVQSFTARTATANLTVLQHINNLTDFANCQVDTLSRILKTASLLSEQLVILCNDNIFDAYTCFCLLTYRRVIVPVRADLIAVQRVNQAIFYLSRHYGLKTDNWQFVAFDYNPMADLSLGTMAELCQGRLLGSVSQAARRRSRRSGGQPYAACLSKKNKAEYSRLIRLLH